MKLRFSLFLVVAAILLAGISVYQWRRSAHEQTQLAVLRGQLEQQSQQVHDLELAKGRLNQQGRELLQQAQEKATQIGQQPATAALSNHPARQNLLPQTDGGQPGAEKGGFGEMLAKMMQDPDTRKFIRDQQRVMMDQLYAPLTKQMGLAPEEADKFKELLADRAAKATDQASSLLGSGSVSNRTEVMGALATDAKAQEDKLKELLGATRYAQYQEYQQTAGERMQLNVFKQQAGAEAALTDQQTEQVLALMKEEKQGLTAAGLPVPGASQDAAGNLQAMLSEDQTEQLLQSQESVNQRVYERAKAVLSAEQLNGLGKFQTNQLQMMRMGMTMARKFLGPDKPGAPIASPP
jgi:hypothetical protein